MKDKPYSDFQWKYYHSLPDGDILTRAKTFLQSVDWEALLKCAADARGGMQCSLMDHIGLGHHHMVRVIQFTDGTQWAARLRLPPLEGEETLDIAKSIECEISTMTLVRLKTSIPVPQVYKFDSSSKCSVKAPFMLMECLDGNAGMDLAMEVPLEHQQHFWERLAKIQVS